MKARQKQKLFLDALQVISDFLNCDLKTGPFEASQIRLPSWLCFDLETEEGVKFASLVQERLKGLLLPVIHPDEDKSLEQSYEDICRLVSTINELNTAAWVIQPPKELRRPGVVGGPYSRYIKATQQASSLMHAAGVLPSYLNLGSIDTDEQYQTLLSLYKRHVGKRLPLELVQNARGQLEGWGLLETQQIAQDLLKPTKMRFMDRQWYFGLDAPQVVLDPVGAAQVLYSLLFIALQRGELERLKVCSVCSALFVAANLNQNYCPEKDCVTIADKKTITARSQRYRQKKRHKKRDQEIEAARRTSIGRFEEFLKAAARHDPDVKTVGAIVKRLGRGSHGHGWKMVNQWTTRVSVGEKAEAIWTSLNAWKQQIFIEP